MNPFSTLRYWNLPQNECYDRNSSDIGLGGYLLPTVFLYLTAQGRPMIGQSSSTTGHSSYKASGQSHSPVILYLQSRDPKYECRLIHQVWTYQDRIALFSPLKMVLSGNITTHHLYSHTIYIRLKIIASGLVQTRNSTTKAMPFRSPTKPSHYNTSNPNMPSPHHDAPSRPHQHQPVNQPRKPNYPKQT